MITLSRMTIKMNMRLGMEQIRIRMIRRQTELRIHWGILLLVFIHMLKYSMMMSIYLFRPLNLKSTQIQTQMKMKMDSTATVTMVLYVKKPFRIMAYYHLRPTTSRLHFYQSHPILFHHHRRHYHHHRGRRHHQQHHQQHHHHHQG